MQFAVGDLFLPKKARDFLDTELVPSLGINLWSFMHLLSGILAKRFISDDSVLLMIHSLFEAWQVHVGMSSSDDILDTVIDTSFYMLGTKVKI